MEPSVNTTITLSQPLTRTRRRFLGSAAMTMLAARLGITGSARAQTAKESTMTTATTPRYAAQDATSTDVRPFRVEVPQDDLDDLRQRLAAVRWPSQELVTDRSQGV
jgi:Epoxide hydrolase N terminus